jgi:hypothetical protein
MKKDVAGFAEAFISWRYIYEKGKVSVPVGRLVAFMRALFRYAREAHPEWKVDEESLARYDGDFPEDILSIVNFGGGLMVRFAR